MQIRVYYEDTDCGGIVYHANYIKYCERARSDFFFSQGIPPIQDNIGFVVKSMQIDFLSPAKLGDLLEIQTQILECKKASILLLQEIFLAQKKIFSAEVLLVALNAQTQKITPLPLWAKEVFAKIPKGNS